MIQGPFKSLSRSAGGKGGGVGEEWNSAAGEGQNGTMSDVTFFSSKQILQWHLNVLNKLL